LLIRIFLIHRLRMDALMRAHPEWLRAPDPDIIAIAGLARSGTTLLQRLMCADPGVRPLLTWEAMSPAPLPDEVAGHPVKRVAEAQQAASFMRYIAPDFSAIHALVVDAPEEDLLLLDMTFMTQSWEAVMWLPSWSKWLEAADNQPAYDYLRNVLKVLIGLSGGAERLVLKTPHHAERLSELLTAFPTATILQTHRDPVKTIPSVCSMIAHMYGAGSNHVDPSQVGTHWLHKTRLMSKKARAARTADPDRVFVDLLYQDLVTDPVSVLERVYAAWGKDLPDEVRAAAAENTVRKATSSRMRHRYRSTDFGFTDEGLRAAFSLDIETYGIPFEEHSA
ncbi:MAG: sulfotransferase, partial [Pseudomonadota bacterium]